MRPTLESRASGQDRCKRLFDIVAAGSLVVVLSPALLILAVLVRLRLGHPIIYKQQRPGLAGRPFTLYKFRSMLDLTDSNGTPLPPEQRTTRFGYLIRAISADELPELWNVIKGDMSLVGPRPLMMHYLPRYNAEQARRHDVRPGITGLAQIGGRNAISWDEKFAMDIEYVDNHDLQMDMAILFRTIGTVVSRKGIRHHGNSEMPEFLGTEAPRSGAGQDNGDR